MIGKPDIGQQFVKMIARLRRQSPQHISQPWINIVSFVTGRHAEQYCRRAPPLFRGRRKANVFFQWFLSNSKLTPLSPRQGDIVILQHRLVATIGN
jgi:hypothetical protein